MTNVTKFALDYHSLVLKFSDLLCNYEWNEQVLQKKTKTKTKQKKPVSVFAPPLKVTEHVHLHRHQGNHYIYGHKHASYLLPYWWDITSLFSILIFQRHFPIWYLEKHKTFNECQVIIRKNTMISQSTSSCLFKDISCLT